MPPSEADRSGAVNALLPRAEAVPSVFAGDTRRVASSSWLSTATTLSGDPRPLTTAMFDGSIPRRSASRATTVAGSEHVLRQREMRLDTAATSPCRNCPVSDRVLLKNRGPGLRPGPRACSHFGLVSDSNAYATPFTTPRLAAVRRRSSIFSWTFSKPWAAIVRFLSLRSSFARASP